MRTRITTQFATALAVGVALTSGQTAAGIPQAGAASDEARSLEAGAPVERELAGGQAHSYRVRLAAGQYLSAVIDQRGVDVVVTVFGPDGGKLTEVDSPNGTSGPEPVQLIADQAGDYRVEVRALEEGAPAGRYEARVLDLRAATQRDYDLRESDRFMSKVDALRSEGRYREVVPFAEQALAFREKAFGPEHPNILPALEMLANAYGNAAETEKSEALRLRAVSLTTAALGPEHPATVSAFHNLGLLYLETGEYAKAEPLLQRALAAGEKVFGPESPGVAVFLTTLGSLYTEQGRYAEAEPLRHRALAIREKLFGPDSNITAMSLNNLADVYHRMGESRKAEPLLRRAAAVWERTVGPEHPNTAFALAGLGEVLVAEGRLDEAEPLLERAHAIWSKSFGPESHMASYALNTLAHLYQRRGDFARAESLYLQVVANEERASGPESHALPGPLVSLGNLYKTTGEYAKAEPLFLRAMAIDEKVLGPGHPDVAADLRRLAELYWAQGDPGRAVPLLARCEEIQERALSANLAAGSEQRKLSYLKLFAHDQDQAVSLSLRSMPSDADAARLALTAILHRKGRALDAVADSIGAARRHASPEGRALLDRLVEARARLAAVTLKGPGDRAPERYRSTREALEVEVERLEAGLGASSAQLRAQFAPVTLDEARKEIPPGAVLVEFAAYRPYDPKAPKADLQFGEPRYAAFVLAGRGEPRSVDLGEAAPMDAAVARLREALRDPGRGDAAALARDLDRLVMQPVRALIGEARQLLVSPDGALNLVPFAALVDERDRYLLERYSITYLTSGRDLVRLRERAGGRSAPLVVANPDFDAAGPALAADREPERRAAFDLGRARFSPLPGAEQEARALARMLPKARVLTGPKATEAAVKRVAAPEILHVASHGLFAEEMHVGGGHRVEDPLLRSWVALAGANRRDGAEDGMLTALEAAGLDLWGTELVVLSGCETGVGEVRTGEGVYGMRRALVLAGSETQVMSLWAVRDRTTRDLMLEYYRALLAGKGRGEAMREVQLGMLRDARRQHPYYWAGFIVSGVWGPLESGR